MVVEQVHSPSSHFHGTQRSLACIASPLRAQPAPLASCLVLFRQRVRQNGLSVSIPDIPPDFPASHFPGPRPSQLDERSAPTPASRATHAKRSSPRDRK